MIDAVTRDKILDAANIVDVVSEFVTLRKRGVNYVGLCPFHSDKSPSFYVSPAKNICKCFACGEGGSPVYFIMKHEQLGYHDALRYLAKKYSIEVHERELTDEERQSHNDRESMFIVNSWAQKHFSARLHEHDEGRNAGLRYFAERGFREETIRKFQLGYSLEQRDDLYQSAIRSGYNKKYLEKTGLITVYDNGTAADRYRGRVIFPIHTISGKVAGFGGRILRSSEKTAKYINSPESEIYHKSNELYGIFFARQAIARADRCYLVEGYTDVISMHQSGVENVVASSGTALTTGQIHLIHRITNNITLIFDGDAAGIKAAIRGVDLLLEAGMNVKIVLLPDGEDPDSFARKNNSFDLSLYIKTHETDFIRFKTQLLLNEAGNDPIRRANLITDIIRSIAVIPDNIIRSVYIKDCSTLLDIKEQTLLNELNKVRARNRSQMQATAPKPPAHDAPEAAAPSEPPPPPPTEAEWELPPPSHAEESPYKAHEEALLRYVIQYGEQQLFAGLDDEGHEQPGIPLPRYIRDELAADDLAFLTPHYRRMLDEAVAQTGRPGFAATRYFLSHADPAISQAAMRLMDDRCRPFFDTAKIDAIDAEIAAETSAPRRANLRQEREQIIAQQVEEFEQAVQRDLFAFKDAYIMRKIGELTRQIRELQRTGDIEGALRLMTEQQQLNEIKKILSKELGERIILKM